MVDEYGLYPSHTVKKESYMGCSQNTIPVWAMEADVEEGDTGTAYPVLLSAWYWSAAEYPVILPLNRDVIPSGIAVSFRAVPIFESSLIGLGTGSPYRSCEKRKQVFFSKAVFERNSLPVWPSGAPFCARSLHQNHTLMCCILLQNQKFHCLIYQFPYRIPFLDYHIILSYTGFHRCRADRFRSTDIIMPSCRMTQSLFHSKSDIHSRCQSQDHAPDRV